MDILVYEHILGEEYSENSPLLLLNEAKLIVKCLIKDFAELYPNSKISLLTNKKNNFLFNDIDVISRDYDLNSVDDMKMHYQNYDKILVLAPEENMEMYNIVDSLEEKGVCLINCSSEFIKITTCKKNTYNNIKSCHENLIDIYHDYKEIDLNKKIVAKISDGLGSENLYIFKNRKDLEESEKIIKNKHFFQDYKNGKIISINIVSNEKKFIIISINEQVYKYKSSCEISLEEVFIGKYNHMIIEFKLFVDRIMSNFTGYHGFFGIDAILDENNNIFLLEINPRLTSSYIGLNASLGFSPIQFLNNINYNFNISNNEIFLKKIKNEK